MQNPWSVIGARHVHPDDEYYVIKHNNSVKKTRQKTQIQRAVPALPYVGDVPKARVILLGRNPSFAPVDEEDMDRLPELMDENLQALTFESQSPFFYLDARFADTNGFHWWEQVLSPVISACEKAGATREEVLGRIACAQWHPYRSIASFSPPELFPTQQYTFHLVEQAAARNALFVVQYGIANERQWREHVPALPQNCIRLKSAQTATLSPKNLSEEDFQRLTETLCKSD